MMMIKSDLSLCLDSVCNNAVLNSTSPVWSGLLMLPHYERENFGEEALLVLSVQRQKWDRLICRILVSRTED